MDKKCLKCGISKRAGGYMRTYSKDPDNYKKFYLYKLCWGCKKKTYAQYKKSFCEFCGFIPVNMCQLDVDHIDGNHKNNNKDNLQTLCANCHRLKTFNQIYNTP